MAKWSHTVSYRNERKWGSSPWKVAGIIQRYFYSFKCLVEGKLVAAGQDESPLEKKRTKEEESV